MMIMLKPSLLNILHFLLIVDVSDVFTHVRIHKRAVCPSSQRSTLPSLSSSLKQNSPA